MRIRFSNPELARSCNSDDERLRTYGPEIAPVLRRRLGEMVAAGHLAEFRSLPAARVRVDPEGASGALLVAVGRSADLRVRPWEVPVPTLDDGHLDELRIQELLVSDIAIAS